MAEKRYPKLHIKIGPFHAVFEAMSYRIQAVLAGFPKVIVSKELIDCRAERLFFVAVAVKAFWKQFHGRQGSAYQRNKPLAATRFELAGVKRILPLRDLDVGYITIEPNVFSA